ncbi:MAG: glycosyltransferase family 1 protein [Xanthobacteraceae bacterium]
MRVEQELARRACRFLGEAVVFGIYDRSQNLFLVIDDKAAADILDGRLQIDFAAEPPPQGAHAIALNRLRGRVRRAMRTNVTVYQVFQLLRGRRYTREEIRQIQQEEFGSPPMPAETPASAKRVEKLSSVSRGPAKLGAASCIISVGMDWQYKDMRSIWTLKQSLGFRYCPMIHDLIPLSFPHFVSPDYDTFIADYLGELIWVADLAMCNSQSTRQDWMRFSSENGVDIPSHVFPLGCDLPAAPAQTALPPSLKEKRFALFVSTIEPRKNHRVLYDAWDRCIRSKTVDAERDRLVFVGRVGWAVNDLMHELSANPATRDSIIVLNDVSDDLLATLYRDCAFVVFPSFSEGYGIPVAEALAYGKPCISSDAGALREIGSEFVLRIDPKDTLRWAETIARYLAHPNDLIDWGRRIEAEHRPMTWDTAADRFFSTVKDAVS